MVAGSLLGFSIGERIFAEVEHLAAGGKMERLAAFKAIVEKDDFPSPQPRITIPP